MDTPVPSRSPLYQPERVHALAGDVSVAREISWSWALHTPVRPEPLASLSPTDRLLPDWGKRQQQLRVGVWG